MTRAIVLVGHGGVPKDFPRDKLKRLKQLEVQRSFKDPMGQEESELDALVRNWTRTPQNDPFKFGTEAIRDAMAQQKPDTKIEVAFNEFCAPTLEFVVNKLILEGATHIDVLSTMLTPGGIHADTEMPWECQKLQQENPETKITYHWPYDPSLIAEFLSRQMDG